MSVSWKVSSSDGHLELFHHSNRAGIVHQFLKDEYAKLPSGSNRTYVLLSYMGVAGSAWIMHLTTKLWGLYDYQEYFLSFHPMGAV